MNAMPTYQEIKSRVNKVIEASIGLEGLELSYIFDGIETRLIKKPEETARILKASNIINNFCGSGDDLTVEVVAELNDSDHNGNHIQKQLIQHLYWDEFVVDFNLSKPEALMLAADYEFSKAMQEWFDAELNKARDKYRLYAQHAHINNGFLS